MPELPEVQTIVDDLNKKIVGRRITDVWFDAPKLIKKPAPKNFEKQIKGLKITDIQRRGKNILIYLTKSYKLKAKSYLLLIHQKLTGHLLIGKWKIIKASKFKNMPRSDAKHLLRGLKVESLIKGPLEEKVNNYIHLVFYLDNGWQVGLSDLRKFAKVLFGLKEEIERLSDLTKIGPEPLEKSFKFIKFIKLIKSEKRKIKQALMDQEIIAGIGNIYSDEILWQAKIHPFKKSNELTANELANLYSAMRQVLKKAIKLRGTSISDYRDTAGKSGGYAKIRFVYRREGELCQRCQTLIKKVKIGGRSAHFCPVCQKDKSGKS